VKRHFARIVGDLFMLRDWTGVVVYNDRLGGFVRYQDENGRFFEPVRPRS